MMVIKRNIISEKDKRLLEHAQGSYKLIYVIIMSVPLIIALENLLLSENPVTSIAQLKDFDQIRLSDVLLFIVFVIMFARFLLGDLRYLDSRYIESIDRDFDIKTHSQRYRFIDFYFLIVHAILFYMLAASILNLGMFYKIFTFILFFNAVWLTGCFYSTPKKNREIIEIKNTIKWAKNNAFFGILLLVFFLMIPDGLSWKYSLYIFFILANINSMVDYILTWDTYFPKIE